MTFKVGDRVTVVWGLDERFAAIVVQPPRGAVVENGRVAVRPVNADPSSWARVKVEQVDTGTISLGPGRHRVTDPETAVLAAEAVEDRLNENQWLVLSALVEAGQAGLIDHEHEARSGLIPTSAGKRRKELERLGLCEPVRGSKRSTGQQRLAQVHRVTARGVAVWQLHQRGAA